MGVRFAIKYIFQNKLQFSNVCDDRKDVLQKFMSVSSEITISVKRNTYRTHFLGMRKDEAINVL